MPAANDDATTLLELERALRATDLASAEDLARGVDLSALARQRARRPDPAPNASAAGLDPLPRRR